MTDIGYFTIRMSSVETEILVDKYQDKYRDIGKDVNINIHIKIKGQVCVQIYIMVYKSDRVQCCVINPVPHVST